MKNYIIYYRKQLNKKKNLRQKKIEMLFLWIFILTKSIVYFWKRFYSLAKKYNIFIPSFKSYIRESHHFYKELFKLKKVFLKIWAYLSK